MEKLKVMVVVGTRPEIIRLSEVIKAIDKYFNLVLVHTGQNYDYTLNQIFFEEFGLKEPDYYLNSPGKHLGETVGNIIAKSYEVINEVKPDALLVLGDTNSCLAAYSAKRLKVPIFHMEAGNRCFDFNVPEEINRRVVDHVSDVNLAYTENARRYLINEGIKNDFLYVTGSPMAEVLTKNMESIDKSNIVEKLGLKEKDYFVVTTCMDDRIYASNFPEDKITAPCGTWRYLQCREICTDELLPVSDEMIHAKQPVFCPYCHSKAVFNQVTAEKYNENGYMASWVAYRNWLQRTINRNVCVIELGVGMRYPTIIRWPFEKIAYCNQKASFVRVHKTLFQLSEELHGKGNSIEADPIDFLLN